MTNQFTLRDILIDPAANTITINTTVKRIEPLVMKLICYLAERHSQVITKKELITHIWPESVVGDEALTRLIFLLRNTLGDDAKQPSYIETIPKKGYRLIVIPITKKLPDDSFSTKQAGILLTCLTIVIAAVAFFYNKSSSFEAREIRQINSVTHSSGIERHFDVNPKTGDILYVHLNKADSQVELKPHNSDKVKRLTNHNSRKRQPLWLDENTLVYIRGANNIYQLMRLTLNNGEEVIYQSSNFIFSITLFDHHILILEESNFPIEQTKKIIQLDLITNKQTDLSTSIPAIPNFISTFAYSAPSKQLFIADNNSSIHQVNLENHSIKALATNFTHINYISALSNNELLVTGRESNLSGTWLVNMSTQEIKIIHSSSGGETITQADLHNDELYFSTSLYDTDIGFENFTNTKPIDISAINTHYDEIYPIFINSYQDVLFFSNRTGSFELWRHNISSGISNKVTSIRAKTAIKPLISDDLQYVAISFKTDDYLLAVVDLKIKKVVQTISTPRVNFPLAFADNNTSIYVSEYDETITLKKLNLTDLSFEAIAKDAGLSAFDNLSANTTDYVDYEQGGVTSVDPSGKITNLNPVDKLNRKNVGQLRITPTHIYTVRNNHQASQLVTIERSSDEITSIELLDSNISVTDISLDGKSVLYHYRTPRGPQGGIYKITFK